MNCKDASIDVTTGQSFDLDGMRTTVNSIFGALVDVDEVASIMIGDATVSMP